MCNGHESIEYCQEFTTKEYDISLDDLSKKIEEADNNHVLDKPHIFLDEIMRQAQDSEIIRLSMWIRDGKPIYSYKPDGN